MSFDTKAESRPSLHVLNLASSNEEADVGYHATFSTAANGRCEPKCMMLQTVQTAARLSSCSGCLCSRFWPTSQNGNGAPQAWQYSGCSILRSNRPPPFRASTDGGTVLYGNAGDDILTGIGGNSLFGGAGDDQIISNPSDNAFDTTVQIDGGEGNDTISIFADEGIENFFNLGSAVATGGDGADEFNVVYDLQNSMGEEQFLDTSLLRITDFNSNEDVFTIEVDRNDETADRSIEVELDQTQENGTYTSLITLTFVEEVNATQAVANLTVISNAAFTLDDIRLVSN
jgi:hypothetical protein